MDCMCTIFIPDRPQKVSSRQQVSKMDPFPWKLTWTLW